MHLHEQHRPQDWPDVVGQHAREIAGRPLSKYTELAKTDRLRAMLQAVEPGQMLPRGTSLSRSKSVKAQPVPKNAT